MGEPFWQAEHFEKTTLSIWRIYVYLPSVRPRYHFIPATPSQRKCYWVKEPSSTRHISLLQQFFPISNNPLYVTQDIYMSDNFHHRNAAFTYALAYNRPRSPLLGIPISILEELVGNHSDVAAVSEPNVILKPVLIVGKYLKLVIAINLIPSIKIQKAVFSSEQLLDFYIVY